MEHRNVTCAVNIGPAGQRQRRAMGLAALALTAVTAVVLIAFVPSRAPRAFLLLPLWMAGLGLFQARAKT